jgi:TM2 domain-containing membrane protein YozV
MNQQLLMMLPNLQPEELITIETVTQDMTENQNQQFIILYQGKRKDQQTLLLLALLGLIGFAGIHRLVIGETAMGLLYFFTAGFCFIGTIVDVINIKSMAYEFNQKQALECANMVKMMAR